MGLRRSEPAGIIERVVGEEENAAGVMTEDRLVVVGESFDQGTEAKRIKAGDAEAVVSVVRVNPDRGVNHDAPVVQFVEPQGLWPLRPCCQVDEGALGRIEISLPEADHPSPVRAQLDAAGRGLFNCAGENRFSQRDPDAVPPGKATPRAQVTMKSRIWNDQRQLCSHS